MSSETSRAGLVSEAVALLRALIATPSFSGEEDRVAGIVQQALAAWGATVHRSRNNVWAFAPAYRAERPTLLLNGHLDTVRPHAAWSRDAFAPDIVDGRLYGLGSNDAGAALVSLLAAFRHFLDADTRAMNLVFSATAEEENSGPNGIEAILGALGPVAAALVGEPTGMQMAVAERGLMVLDCVAHGRAGHAARAEGDNAIVHALRDIRWFHSYRFPRESAMLGSVSMNVTAIHAGRLHNVIPDRCEYLVDVRSTDAYSNEEVLDIVRRHVSGDVTPRSLRLRATALAPGHPLVAAGRALGREAYASPTTSNKALLPFPALKMGPGASSRSHTADEFILLDEISEGIELYIAFLERLLTEGGLT